MKHAYIMVVITGLAGCGLPDPETLKPPCTSDAQCAGFGDEFAGHRCLEGRCVLNSCGDAKVDALEGCDDGNTVDNDACSNACALARCGDGILRADLSSGQVGFEACDDGNTVDEDACSNACSLEACGDGIVQASEACDDGNQANTDACTNACELARCGDGILRTGLNPGDAGFEACDDNNQDSGDGCSALCASEACGDGQLDAGEGCDDGNEVGGDGCSAACRSEVAQMDAGGSSTCARLHNGGLRCWGANGSGKLGAGLETSFQRTPVAVIELGSEPATQVSVGSGHVCAIVGRGQLYCWGNNFQGQVGVPEAGTSGVFPPVKPLAEAIVLQVAAGHFHSCVIMANDGEIRCWGGVAPNVDRPLLGDGSTAGSRSPTWVLNSAQERLTKAEELIIGGFHTCAILGRSTNLGEQSNPSGNQTACWGINGDNRLWRAAGEERLLLARAADLITPMRGGATMGSAGLEHTCITPRIGGREPALICLGSNRWGAGGDLQRDNGNIRALAAGDHHTCFVTRGGEVRCWGYNADGAVGAGLPGSPCSDQTQCNDPFVCEVDAQLDVNRRCTVACTRGPRGEQTCSGDWSCQTQTNLCRGPPERSQVIWYTRVAVAVPGIAGAVEVVAGSKHSCARTSDNQVYCWGSNDAGQIGVDSGDALIADATRVPDL